MLPLFPANFVGSVGLSFVIINDNIFVNFSMINGLVNSSRSFVVEGRCRSGVAESIKTERTDLKECSLLKKQGDIGLIGYYLRHAIYKVFLKFSKLYIVAGGCHSQIVFSGFGDSKYRTIKCIIDIKSFKEVFPLFKPVVAF